MVGELNRQCSPCFFANAVRNGNNLVGASRQVAL
jgi:hypothetical protein